MIVQFLTYNNGYTCSCCSSTWDEHEWIKDEDVLTLDKIYDEAKSISADGVISKMYEREGKELYGYTGCTQGRGNGLSVYICLGGKDYLIRNDRTTDVKLHTKEEILQLYNT